MRQNASRSVIGSYPDTESSHGLSDAAGRMVTQRQQTPPGQTELSSACWHVPGSLGFERLAMIGSGASTIAIKCYVLFTVTQPILAHDTSAHQHGGCSMVANDFAAIARRLKEIEVEVAKERTVAAARRQELQRSNKSAVATNTRGELATAQ
jgi:hypothetical protein